MPEPSTTLPPGASAVLPAAAPAAPGSALERAGPALKARVEKVLASSPMGKVEQHPQWAMIAKIPMPVKVAVALPRFRVRHLLALDAGQVHATASAISEDLPLIVGEVKLGWGEFEVTEQRLAIRLTRLA